MEEEDDEVNEDEEDEQRLEDIEEDITEVEIKNAIKTMKNGKACGPDFIPVELIKEGGPMIVKWLMKIFQRCWREVKIPSEWGTAVICPIIKKRGKMMCEQYRGITLLCHVMKLYERVIEKRLRTVVENKITDCQYGFRPGRGTTNLVFALRHILEKAWEFN